MKPPIPAGKVVIHHRAFEAAMKTGCAPDGFVFLVIAENSEGRPCGWATGKILGHVTEVANEMWSRHGHGDGCYPGEERGENVVKIIPDDK